MNMNSSIPMVSIQMITYNHEKYISEAIEGVLKQRADFKFELVIGEDCSTDNTKIIVKEYCKKYPNTIRVVPSEKNIGMTANGIKTLKACSGKYIAICEGDDYWNDPLKLQKQIDMLESNHKLSLCFHNVNTIFEDNKSSIIPVVKREIKSGIYSIKAVIMNKPRIATSSMVFVNSHINPLPEWFQEVRAGEKAIQLIVASWGDIAYLSDTMSVYRNHSDGISNNDSHFDRLWIYHKLFKLFNKYTKYKYLHLTSIRLLILVLSIIKGIMISRMQKYKSIK